MQKKKEHLWHWYTDNPKNKISNSCHFLPKNIKSYRSPVLTQCTGYQGTDTSHPMVHSKSSQAAHSTVSHICDKRSPDTEAWATPKCGAPAATAAQHSPAATTSPSLNSWKQSIEHYYLSWKIKIRMKMYFKLQIIFKKYLLIILIW